MTPSAQKPAELLSLADKLDNARHSRIVHGINVDLSYQEMDLARDTLRLAAAPCPGREVDVAVSASKESASE